MAIILKEDEQVLNYENQPEIKRNLLQNLFELTKDQYETLMAAIESIPEDYTQALADIQELQAQVETKADAQETEDEINDLKEALSDIGNEIFGLSYGGDIKIDRIVYGYYIDETTGKLTSNANMLTIYFTFPNNEYVFIHNTNRRNISGKIVAFDSNGMHTLDDVDSIITNYSTLVRRTNSDVTSLALSMWIPGHSQGGTITYDEPYITQIAKEKIETNAPVQLKNGYPFIGEQYNSHYSMLQIIVGQNGVFTNNNSLFCYGYTPVNQGDIITFNIDTTNNYNAFSVFACFFDENFDYISAVQYADSIVAPDNARYVVANFFMTDKEKISIKIIERNPGTTKIDERALPTISSRDYKAYPIYANIANDVAEVTFKYDAYYDETVQMRKQGGLIDGEPTGGNQLFDFCRWFLTENTYSIVTNSPDTSSENTKVVVNGTDFLGPYRVRAINNADGDKETNNDFTGGNHQYNNSGSGSTATARTANLVFKIDNTEVTTYSGYCRIVEIEWDNYIQGNNTKKSDGSGREILKEHYRIRFDGDKFYVYNDIVALEELYIYTYYGMQIKGQYNHVNAYNLLFVGSEASRYAYSMAIPDSGSMRYCGDLVTREIANGNGNISSAFINRENRMHMDNIGLGMFKNTKAIPSSCMASTGKIYFNLISALDTESNLDMTEVVTLQTGEHLYYSGWYSFNKK